ncbi:unnamed protein product [Caenorhabditis angaria]|uniref:F-box domain-containing protein n=1 Tax=Caenorhabditis angaria TaxID=860376 RepID=A0A9P1N175_9PELO|nr:unnamed protein product [Caenorhabditis angaria]
MDPKTRCIFTRCSKLCELDAKKSRFFIYGLSIDENESGYDSRLKFMFDEEENGFWLDFEWFTNSNQTIVVCSCLKSGKNTVIWTKLETGENQEVRLRYLRYYLEIYRKQLQFFRFNCSERFDFTLRHLDNLKKIEIGKTPKEWENIEDLPFLDENQLLKIDSIKLPKIGFSSEDLFNFQGKNGSFDEILDLNEANCKKYLNKLKNGEICVDFVEISKTNLDHAIFSGICEGVDGIRINFQSEDRRYLVTFDRDFVLKIETIEVFKKLDKFTCWPQLPPEIQQIVANKIELKTRWRFSQCSKKSENQALRSENYLYKIEVNGEDETPKIQFAFTDKPENDFWLKFIEKYEDQTIVLYKISKNGEAIVKWTEVVDGKPEDVRIKYLNNYIAKYGRAVKYFYYGAYAYRLRDIDISNFRNLDKIEIDDQCGGEYFDWLGLGYIDWNTIRRCKHILLYNEAVVNFEQLLEMDPLTADIECNELCKGNNFEIYLMKLKNGEIQRNLKNISLRETFDMKCINYEKFGPFLTKEINAYNRRHIFQAKNRIIEVFQQFEEREARWCIKSPYISIKIYGNS